LVDKKGQRVEDQLSSVVDAPPEEKGSRLSAPRDAWSPIMDDRPANPKTPPAREGDSSGEPRRAAPKPRFRLSLATAARVFILASVVALVVVIAREWDWWVGSAVQQTTDDAYLRADLTPLSAKVLGYVRRVRVGDFQRVHAGDLLVEIVDDDYRAELEQAQANVAAAKAAIESVEQQKLLQATIVKQAEADIAASEADLTRYHLESVRQQELLVHSLAGTPQLTEQAVDNERRAEAALALTRAKLEQQRQQLKVLDSQEAQAMATLDARRAARDSAAINLGYTRITSPVDGMVSERLARPGQYLSVGSQVISIVPLPNVWIVANYKETQMTRIRVGQPAHATVDAFPGLVLRGHVDGWSPGSGAEFSLLPPDNATGNFTKVIQRIPVKIVLDPDPALGDLLRPGMSVVATIDTGSHPADSGAQAK
jgi:membrane fusion protein (multidrug efflux system)